MKLNQKKEIVVQKSNERKLEIQEGAKLARSVDALRETHSVEQQKLKKFRDDSLALIKSEISTFIEERNGLKTDVEFLREQKKVLLDIPLDAEWNLVENKQRHLTDLEIILQDRILQSRDKEKSIEEIKKQLSIEKERIYDERLLSTQKLSEANLKLSEATLKLRTAESEIEKSDEYAYSKGKDIFKKEENVSIRERDIANKEITLQARERELNNRERAINDKYEVLLRTEKRINKL